MPISHTHTRGFKNPPLFALDGRGPPAHQTMSLFYYSLLQGWFLFCMLYTEKAKRQYCPDLRTVIYAAEVYK